MAEQIGLEAVFKTEAFASGLSKYTSGLNSAISETGRIGGSIGSLLSAGLMAGVTAFAALSTAAIAAGGAIAGVMTSMVMNAANMADAFNTMSEQTGISIERLQELSYAGKLLDVDLDTMTSAQKFLTKAMYASKDGTGAQADAFKALGIKVVDAKGHLLAGDVVMGQVIDKLGAMTNETERDAVAMQLMGRNAMELNPLIKAGSKALAQYSQEAHDMGAVVSEQSILALDQFKDRMDALKESGKGIFATLAMNFLPVFSGVEDGVRGFVKDFSTLLATSSGNPLLMAKGFTALLKTTMQKLTKGIPQLTRDISGVVRTITRMIVDNAPTLIKGGGELLTALLQGFAANLPQMMRAGLEIVSTIWDALVAAAPSLLHAGGQLIDAIGEGIMSTLGSLPSLNSIISWIFTSAANVSTDILNWVKSVDWGALSKGIADAISSLDWSGYGTQFSTMITNLAKSLYTFLTTTEWGDLFHSIGMSIGDFIAGAIKPGETWKTVWKTQWGPTLDLLQQMIKDYGWYAVGVEIWKQIMIGILVGMVGFMKDLNMFKNFPNSPAPAPSGPGKSGTNGGTYDLPSPRALVAPTAPVNTLGYLAGSGYVGAQTSSITNINTNVYNPSQESASTSVDKTLRKLSYLGAV